MIELAYINVLWILFSSIGLIIFGIFPATAAMFSVVGKLIKNEESIKIFPAYWTSFRSYFLQANGFGLIFYLLPTSFILIFISCN